VTDNNKSKGVNTGEKAGRPNNNVKKLFMRPSAFCFAGPRPKKHLQTLSLLASSLACHFQWALPSVCSKSQKQCHSSIVKLR
jgi:hypothetical protein